MKKYDEDFHDDDERERAIAQNGNDGLAYEVLTDPLDIASQNEQIATNSAIKDIQAKASKLEVEATGHCLFCRDNIADGLRWCKSDDNFCRDEWQKQRTLRG